MNLDLSKFSDDEWFEMLKLSTSKSIVNGIEFPTFPDAKIQSQFVGSSYEASLSEAFNFYKLTKEFSGSFGSGFNFENKLLDFGCGWGRFLRFFRKDFKLENLYGVDIDPDILEICRKTKVEGSLSRIYPTSALSFPQNYFDTVIAYSVFTHLPENIHLHWMKELAKVTKPGAIFAFTLESERFINFIESIDSSNLESGWHAGLASYKPMLDQYRSMYSKGEFVYLPTGGGDYREAEVYGDAIVSKNYIENKWSDYFELIEYIDDGSKFWQAVVIVRRNNNAI
jgi:ubiquinone/menaquinone biosynthesis C-methylase UbiE